MKYNKERILIVILSLIISICLFLLFAIGVIFTPNTYWYLYILYVFVLIGALYAQSKFLIMPLYNKLVLKITKDSLGRFKEFDYKVINKINNDFYYFYNKDYIDISNHLLISNKNVKIDIFDFCNSAKKGKKDDSETFYGKSITLCVEGLNIENQAFIMQNRAISNKMKEFYINKFNKIDDSLSSKKRNRYFALYDNKVDMGLFNLLNDLSDFNALIVKDNVLQIYSYSKSDGFNFRLQEKLKDDVNVYCKEKYASSVKLIFSILDYVKGE